MKQRETIMPSTAGTPAGLPVDTLRSQKLQKSGKLLSVSEDAPESGRLPFTSNSVRRQALNRAAMADLRSPMAIAICRRAYSNISGNVLIVIDSPVEMS